MSKRLLLADDSVTIQKVVELILTDEDFEIKSVGTGEDAWALIREFMPDVVLADIEMPNMNGYQLCEKIKKDEMTMHIPVILLAGAFEPIDEELAKEVEADDYIVKPFESHELISKINAILAEKEVAEEGMAEALEEVAAGEGEGVDVAETAEAEAAEVEAAEAEATEVEAAEAEAAEVEAAEAVGATEGEKEGEEDLWDKEGLALEPSEDTWGLEEELSFEEEEVEAVEAVEEPFTGEGAEEEVLPPYIEETTAVEEKVKEEVSLLDAEEIKAMLKGVAEEKISDMISSFDSNELYSVLTSSVENKLQDMLGSFDLQGLIAENITTLMKPTIEKLIIDTTPKLIEETIKETMDEISSLLKQQVERVIWETVPDLAETIITREVERIKSTF